MTLRELSLISGKVRNGCFELLWSVSGRPGGAFEGSKRGVDLGHVFSHEWIIQSCPNHGLDRLMSFWRLRS
jgi:hypothetical protein